MDKKSFVDKLEHQLESEFGKVLQFPKRISQNKILKDKIMSNRLTMGLSLLSVIMISTFFNQIITSNSATDANSSRAVASLHSQEEMSSQLRRLDSSNQVFAAERPSRLDELLVGELRGQVHVEMEGNKIVQLDWEKGVNAIASKEAAQKLVADYMDQFALGQIVYSYYEDGSLRSIAVLK